MLQTIATQALNYPKYWKILSGVAEFNGLYASKDWIASPPETIQEDLPKS